MAEQVPWLTATEFAASYFEDDRAPGSPLGLREPLPRRVAALPRLAHVVASLRPRLLEAEGRVMELEALVRAALTGGTGPALGEALARARKVSDEVWSAHMTATAALPALRALQRAVGTAVTPFWEELEPWANRPDEVVWDALRLAKGLGLDPGPGAAFSAPFYEIASDREPWSGLGGEQPRAYVAGDPSTPWLDPAAAFWRAPQRVSTAALRSLSRAVGDTMANREFGKSLAMRALHVLRRLVPVVAAAQSVRDADWPYLTVTEIADAHRIAGLANLAATRRAECEAALSEPAPEVLDGSAAAGPRSGSRRAALGVSPGTVSGVVVDAEHVGAREEGERILVSNALDAGLQPVLARVDGVLTARGSLLSHVAILVRERGIPAVVGHPLAAQLRPGDRVWLNGSTGEVTQLDD